MYLIVAGSSFLASVTGGPVDLESGEIGTERGTDDSVSLESGESLLVEFMEFRVDRGIAVAERNQWGLVTC